MKKLIGKQSNLDLNKNGKLDSQDFKMLRSKKAYGGTAESSETGTFIGGENASSMYKKGGNLKKKANYVPNYMVQSVEVERKGKTTDIDGANVLDGVYVKKGVKFETGGRIKVGTFNEAQLKNKEDKKAVEKAQKETGLKYVDTKIIKKGGKMFMEVYLIPTDEYLKSSKFANGGDLADMPESFPETDMMSYEDGGSTSTWEYSIGGL